MVLFSSIHVMIGRDRSYFVQKTLWFYQNVLWNWYQNVRVFDWQNICDVWWTCFQQTVGKPIDTNCAPLLAVLFFHSYEVDFTQELLKKNEKKLSRSFNFTFRYIDYVLSLNNSRLGDFVDCIYPIELEIKDTTDTDMPAIWICGILYFKLHTLTLTSKLNETLRQKTWFKFSYCELSISI